MSKLSFRARALDPSKPLNIHIAEELPDLTEYSAINRAVPQMPSGMEKEEESVRHFFIKIKQNLSGSLCKNIHFCGSHLCLLVLCVRFNVWERNEATPSCLK